MTRKSAATVMRETIGNAPYREWVGEAPPAYGEAVARMAEQIAAIALTGPWRQAVIDGIVRDEAKRLQREHPELWGWFDEHGAAWRAHKPALDKTVHLRTGRDRVRTGDG